MKRNAGWATASVLAVATAMSVSSTQPKPAAGLSTDLASRGSIAANGAHRQSTYKGPCKDLETTFGVFFNLPESTLAAVAPPTCKAEETSKENQTVEVISKQRAKPALKKTVAKKATGKANLTGSAATSNAADATAQTVHFVIATLPDPLHTHLSLDFDRDTEAIQQAAQDSGYTYDSSWLPWETEQSERPLVADQDEMEKRKERLEDQPGILLFRKALPAQTKPAATPAPPGRSILPYRDTVVVFVVGEEPTDGIHRKQFDNAARWIHSLESLWQPDTEKPAASFSDTLQILGPNFSGSLPSLQQLLQTPETRNIPKAQPAKNLAIYSGQITSGLGVHWFQDATGDSSGLGRKINFLSFQQEDDEAMARYYAYLEKIDIHKKDIAIVSEDETAYGYIEEAPADTQNGSTLVDAKPEQPVSFYYPRDISAVRAAYQEQSLFSGYTLQPTMDTARHTLRNDLADTEGKKQDTIRDYGASQTALSEEAVLLQIVDMLRAHQSKFILLKSSNPLDQLFLAHFFKLTYPQARVVTLGSDLLLRRETGSSGLNGILTLSTYPLLPEIDDWTEPVAVRAMHSHRAFTQQEAEGTYVALRALLGSVDIDPTSVGPFLPGLRDNKNFSRVGDYAAPFWLPAPCPGTFHQPNTWLTVLGNNGFSPVASLGPVSIDPDPPSCSCVRVPEDKWPEVPMGMNLALLMVLGWSIFHAVCCCSASITVRPEHRSYFVRIRKSLRGNAAQLSQPGSGHPKSHLALILGGCVLMVIVAMVLAWGYGWMSDDPAPIQHARLYALFPVAVWTIGAFALAANAWVEYQLNFPGRTGITLFRILKYTVHWKHSHNWPGRIADALRATFLPLFCYTLLTFGFYWLFKELIDAPLASSARNLTYFRSMDLTSGVSPIVPVALLTLGMYGWCWYSLRGIGLFGADRPLLPKRADLRITLPDNTTREPLTMLSHEKAAYPMERLCWPFNRRVFRAFGIIFAVILLADIFIFHGIPLRSLGRQKYSGFICIWIAISISLMLANAWQLVHLWLRLQALLVFLDKLPLRRTMQDMRGFTWGSIWKIGGNVLDIRYKLFYRQLEALNHLRASLIEEYPGSDLPNLSVDKLLRWIGQIESTRPARWRFATWYAKYWDKWTARDLCTLQWVQQDIARSAGIVLAEILIPEWGTEKNSLMTASRSTEETSESDNKDVKAKVDHLKCYVRNAEEIVCLVYLGFIQNIVGRIRTFVMGMISLFLSIALVVPVYPFDPRVVLASAVIILFIGVGVVVFTVYSQMFRDATLSHLTNTKPGELGSEFWLRFVSFGVGPVFGLLATTFPQFSDFFFSWLQPSLSAIK
jgi:hypothetical protein